MCLREISASAITDAVARLCIEANYRLTPDIRGAFVRGQACEVRDVARDVLDQLIQNADIAAEGLLPICQDTGMTVVFVRLGQDVHITGGAFRGAIDEGIRRGYAEGYLRKSVVRDPTRRVNTGDNTPGIVYTEVVPGDSIHLVVAPKGFGSENMSAVAMLTPSQGIDGVKRVVMDTVRRAGPNPCPPIVVGVGVGGTMEYAALIAKRALLRPVGSSHADAYWADAEASLLREINATDIGPAGLGGVTTALAVHIETYPTHIAGLPVAVNIGCHATRHAETTL